MKAVFIVAYVLFYLLVAMGAIYLYTYSVYSKNTVFKRPKNFDFTILFYAILWVFALVLGIVFATTIKSKGTIPNIPTHLALCFTLVGIDSVYIVIYCILVKINSKGKISYTDINGVDFKTKLANAKAKLGDIEVFKNQLAKDHKKYYQAMMTQYKVILERAKDSTLTRAQKLADIVIFDETFTHKWSNKVNLYKTVLSLEYLTLI